MTLVWLLPLDLERGKWEVGRIIFPKMIEELNGLLSTSYSETYGWEFARE